MTRAAGIDLGTTTSVVAVLEGGGPSIIANADGAPILDTKTMEEGHRRARAVGIDLGTTTSVVAVLEGGKPSIIANAEGAPITPSVVAFAKDGQVLSGEIAKRQSITNGERTICSVKRHLGTDWSIDVDDESFNAQQICAFILQKLKQDAEAYLGEEVTDAVIAVPACFTEHQRQATKEAAEIAGLDVSRIINEPTAAALAYGFDNGEAQTILIFDLGGGTFDVSLLEVGDGIIEMKATSGDNRLGGDDWDEKVVDWIVDKFKADTRIDLTKDKMAIPRVRQAAERAKIELSSSSSTSIKLPYITVDSEQNPVFLDETLNRSKFEQITSDLLERIKAAFNNVIKDAGIELSAIDHVMLVGGSTHMPAVAAMVKQLTGGKEPHRWVNTDEVVAVGASLQAGALKGEVKDVLLLDVTPLSLDTLNDEVDEATRSASTKLNESSSIMGQARYETASTKQTTDAAASSTGADHGSEQDGADTEIIDEGGEST